MSTLLIEKGREPAAVPRPKGLLARALNDYDNRSGERWPEKLLLRRDEKRKFREVSPILGIGPGGSGRIYGAALGRASRADFERDFQPSDWNGGEESALRNDWPISYDDFLPFYREAEEMLGLVGELDSLDPDDDAALGRPPDLSPAHEAIVRQLKANGRHPYRMHVGIAYKPGCSECQGSSCARDCKAHGFNRALVPAIERGDPVELSLGATLDSLSRGQGEDWLVAYTDGQGQREARAAQVVLAMGALNSPRILQRSASLWDGDVPELVGRGLMFHAMEIFSVKPPNSSQLYGPRKVLAFRDHYFDGPMPLAECQSLGMVAKSAMIASFLNTRLRLSGFDLGNFGALAARPIGEVAERIFAETEMFTANVQDLPYRDNCVHSEIDSDGRERIAITYLPRAETIERTRRFRQLMTEAFDPLEVRFLSAIGEPNLGHPMGTCRMGRDPSSSVTDDSGQVWNQPGLYVADASVFPSSLGLNPALTVAAHALRVSRTIIRKAGSTG